MVIATIAAAGQTVHVTNFDELTHLLHPAAVRTLRPPEAELVWLIDVLDGLDGADDSTPPAASAKAGWTLALERGRSLP